MFFEFYLYWERLLIFRLYKNDIPSQHRGALSHRWRHQDHRDYWLGSLLALCLLNFRLEKIEIFIEGNSPFFNQVYSVQLTTSVKCRISYQSMHLRDSFLAHSTVEVILLVNRERDKEILKSLRRVTEILFNAPVICPVHPSPPSSPIKEESEEVKNKKTYSSLEGYCRNKKN